MFFILKVGITLFAGRNLLPKTFETNRLGTGHFRDSEDFQLQGATFVLQET